MSEDVKNAIQEMGKTFEEFKKVNDEKLEAIEKGESTAYVDEKLAKMEAKMDSYEDINQKLTIAEQNAENIKSQLDKLETVNVKTRDSSINALRVIDRSLDRIHRERAKLGALMSRMEKAIDNLTNVAVNTEASRGRIRDANFAKESSTLTKAQILQQSALAMIAQAGRIQQNVLTLLQN